jgi:hypothetical protein
MTIGQRSDTIRQISGWAKWRSDRDPTRSDRGLAKPSDDRTEIRHDRAETWLSQVMIGQSPGTIGQRPGWAKWRSDRAPTRSDRDLGPHSLSTCPDKTRPANPGGERTQIEITRGKSWNLGALWRCSADKIGGEETPGDRAFGRHQHGNS